MNLHNLQKSRVQDAASSGLARNFFWVTEVCAFLAMTTSTVTLIGLVFDNPQLIRFLPEHVGMQPYTALNCLLLAMVLLLQNHRVFDRRPEAGKSMRMTCALVLALLIVVLFGSVLDMGLSPTYFGKMAFQTVLSFILITLGLLLLDWEPKPGHRPVQYLAMAGMMFPLQAFVIHVNRAVYGSTHFISFQQMSMPAAISVFSLALGLLTVRPQHGFMQIVSSVSLAGQIVRRLFFPLIISIPIISILLSSSVGVFFDPSFAGSAFIMIIILLVMIMTWITAETVRSAEVKLRESEDRFRQIFEKAPVGMAELDPHTQRFLHVNASCMEMLGRSEEDLQQMTLAEAGLPEIENGSHFIREHGFIRKDGANRWASLGGVKLKDGEGEPSFNLLIAEDITERRNIAEVNRLSEERLKLALTASEIGFYDWDIKRNVMHFDPRMSNDWGLVESPRTLEEALALIHPDDQVRVQEKVNDSVETGHVYTVEYRVIRPADDRIVFVEVRGEVQKDSDGNPARFVGTCLNITERKKAEQELLESEARFRRFMDAMPQMAFVTDAKGRVTYFNQRHYEYFGIDPTKESYEWETQNLHHPDDIQRTIELWTQCVETEQLYQIEYRLRRSDGEYRWHLGRAIPVRNSQGEVIQWLGTNTDIHEQKVVSQKLQENEAKFRTIADAMPQMVWSTLADGYHDYYNKRWYEFTGVLDGSTDGEGWNDMFHPDDQERAWEMWRHSLETGDPYEIEYRLRHRSGQYRWTLGRALPVKDEQGKIIRWMGTCTDIHDQKLASEVLAASEAKLRAILSQLPVGVVIADVDGQIMTTNETFRQICGGVRHVGLESYQEYEAYWFSTGQRLASEDWALARALTREEVILNEVIRLKGFNGEEKIILNSATPVHVETGELTGAIAVVQDITEQKRFEVEAGMAKDAAERANRAKSQFLANMSHEIRSPMNSVIGYADLLTEPGLSDDERIMYASRIKASGSHLLHIIDDILDLSKVESGHFQIEWRRFAVVELVSECIQSMSVLARKKKIDLVVFCDTPVPQFIESDSIRFRQILMNVIGNAIKFTERGQVRVGLRFLDKSVRGPAYFVVDVEDSGIGISLEQQKELFRPFMQSDASITRKFGGTGLGLHLSRRLAEALGGELQLAWSVPDQGSCFTIKVLAGALIDTKFVTSLEKQQTVHLAQSHVEPSFGKKYKVLVVDDNADNQALMKAYLRKADVHWDSATDGEKAVALALRNPYDIILMDVMMPVMDGLEATRRLRAAGYKRPIIALTAHAMQEEVEKSFAAGCDGHLSKPVDVKELLATMKRFVELSARSEQQMFH
jgi:PAS domain S-box-containing protein